MKLTVTGIDKAIAHIDRVENNLPAKLNILSERLCEYGIKIASFGFAAADYDGNNDVKVSSSPEWIDENTIAFYADGEAVTFIEFGAGVYQPTYPKSDIIRAYSLYRGEYGQGKGKRRGWVFYHPITGELTFTRGTPPARAMFDASEQMRQNILKIAKEVFGND